jgi:hypothetical protein
MIAAPLHLAPNAPWPALLALGLALVALGVWAYRFAVPPLTPAARRLLPALRVAALLLVALLLARPTLVGRTPGRAGVVVLLDRSASMDLPVAPGGPARAAAADEAVRALRRGWAGRARLTVLPFAAGLGADTARAVRGGATALGDALAALGDAAGAGGAAGPDAGAVVVVSDGAVNAGRDPVAAARALGLPVHAVAVGRAAVPDRALGEVEAQGDARTGRPTVVRARVTSTEERGAPLAVRLLDGARELARVVVPAPGPGAEALAELRVVPDRPGLAVWTVRVDSLAGGLTAANDARQVAVDVAPGRLGVRIVSAELNWDLAFLRRALAGDSTLAVETVVRGRGGWERLGAARASRGVPPGAGDLRGAAVVVLDGIAPAEAGADFERALAAFVRGGGGLLVLGGPAPGLARLRGGLMGADLAVATAPGAGAAGKGSPEPDPAARDLVGWDSDPARGERAWRLAAPLADVMPLRAGPGDRVLVRAAGGAAAGSADRPPLLLARRVGRGQALLVNGTGLWRWSLSGSDELSAERGTALWRRLVRWLAEPAQAEPLRVEPERRLAAGGETVRLFATLQDSAFRPLAGAEVTGELRGTDGRARPVRFVPAGTSGGPAPAGPAATGSYVAELEDLPPARYRLSARATRGGRELGRAACEFAVDRWSLELARALPDSAALAALAAATGGRVTAAVDVERWARDLPARDLARGRDVSSNLWESPLPYAVVLGLLGVEWVWRRRRGLP